MGVRETLEKNSTTVRWAATGVSLLSLLIVWHEVGSGSAPVLKPVTNAYFSDDDGATYFSDSRTLIPPFDHGGKQAVSAIVARCSDGQPFIVYLQRYTPKGLAMLQSVQPGASVPSSRIEVSLPLKGDAGWKTMASPPSREIVDLKCPSGAAGDYPMVLQP